MRKLFDVLCKAVATLLLCVLTILVGLIMIVVYDTSVFGDMPDPDTILKNIWKL